MVELDALGRRYFLHGIRIYSKGWLDIYPFYNIKGKGDPADHELGIG